MAITKPATGEFPDLKVVKKNEQINLSLTENTNDSVAPAVVQLIVKRYSETNENGDVLPAGNYGVYMGDSSFLMEVHNVD